MKIGSYTIVPAGDEHDEYFLVTYTVRNGTSMTVQVSVGDLETTLATLFIQSDMNNDFCWIKRTINDLFCASKPNKDIVEGLLEGRIPTLTHEDMEDMFGDAFIDMVGNPYYKLEDLTLYLNPEKEMNLTIILPAAHGFSAHERNFKVDTRLELQDLMRMLGIKN